MAKKLIDIVKSNFGDHVLDSHSRHGNDTVVVDKDHVAEIIGFLRDDSATQMNLLRDITAVDYHNRVPRYEVVYILYSIDLKHMLILRAPLQENDLKLPTISHLYGCAAWLEREVYDMYGVAFDAHPDLRRVLLYEEFEGHPLRKDYAIQDAQPRMELRMRERDSVEEFNEYVKDQPAAGSRGEFG